MFSILSSLCTLLELECFKKFSCNSVLKSNFPLFIPVAEDWEIVWKLQWVINPEDPTTMLRAYTHNWDAYFILGAHVRLRKL